MGFPAAKPTLVRYGVMAYLCSLAFVLYVDRVCIGQAGTSMKRDLELSDTQWGMVGGAFMIAYGVFEVITGHWGDRYGSRRVLARIVLWWSAFTALTGCLWLFSYDSGLRIPLPWTNQDNLRAEIPLVFNSFLLLLLVRFLFGAGEAGALPNAARVIGKWFPPGGRGPSQAFISMSAQVGGAVAPPVAAFLILRAGWRWSFAIFGSLGVIWAYFFARWFRDEPSMHPAVNKAELQFIAGTAPNTLNGTVSPDHHPAIPWRRVLATRNIWLLGMANACTAFYSYMLFFWFPTYLKEGREAGEMMSGWLACLPLALGAVGVMAAGFLGDWLTRRLGSRRLALCGMGFVGLTTAGLLVGASMFADNPLLAVMLCALGFMFADVQLAAWWAAMGDVGGRHLGALFGFCNMIGIAGGFASQVSLGFFLDYMKSLGFTGRAQWDPAFYVFSGLLLFGAVCWLFIDPTRRAVPEDNAHA